ncbi:hypothetical protein M427DRAFT_62868 [Gonapodya prolifera JEL478]|uniref:SH3 domain-containing protein n=1 Tax=Gonapodya prolifera (strain JEL478) TaxID=1344416 RepID=A0A139A194_GONPJ|nr:hypothetical protein M427DRAFT_62868 [Gonapodya prolifera JEL478]|eukprot:KXS10123.1 hypothetical protein M427DRAFT_62868 [Gonapodya prolifera JEL478]
MTTRIMVHYRTADNKTGKRKLRIEPPPETPEALGALLVSSIPGLGVTPADLVVTYLLETPGDELDMAENDDCSDFFQASSTTKALIVYPRGMAHPCQDPLISPSSSATPAPPQPNYWSPPQDSPSQTYQSEVPVVGTQSRVFQNASPNSSAHRFSASRETYPPWTTTQPEVSNAPLVKHFSGTDRIVERQNADLQAWIPPLDPIAPQLQDFQEVFSPQTHVPDRFFMQDPPTVPPTPPGPHHTLQYSQDSPAVPPTPPGPHHTLQYSQDPPAVLPTPPGPHHTLRYSQDPPIIAAPAIPPWPAQSVKTLETPHRISKWIEEADDVPKPFRNLVQISKLDIVKPQEWPARPRELHEFVRMSRVKALYNYRPSEFVEISMRQYESIEILTGIGASEGWAFGLNSKGSMGYFPLTHCDDESELKPKRKYKSHDGANWEEEMEKKMTEFYLPGDTNFLKFFRGYPYLDSRSLKYECIEDSRQLMLFYKPADQQKYARKTADGNGTVLLGYFYFSNATLYEACKRSFAKNEAPFVNFEGLFAKMRVDVSRYELPPEDETPRLRTQRLLFFVRELGRPLDDGTKKRFLDMALYMAPWRGEGRRGKKAAI